ncbi:BTB/POZ domain-containing protein At1g30440 [Linum grandiflorum]
MLARIGIMKTLIPEATEEDEEKCTICLSDVPGGAKTFELVAKFCYGQKLELTASNVVYLRCAAEQLEMTEDYGEGNLIVQTETFLNHVVLRNWKDSLKALQTCDLILSYADRLNVTKRCIDSLALKASRDPNLFGWPIVEHGPMGISTGARPKNPSTDWWYEDASSLSLPLYKRLISTMESRGIKDEIIAGSIAFYAKMYLPGLNRRQGASTVIPLSLGAQTSEEDQRALLEEIDRLLPMQKCLVSTRFLFRLLKTAMILKADESCLSSLEKRIGMQLDQASLDDLLMPNFSHSMETLYNVDCMQRILEHFVAMDDQSLTPITMVAKLIDGYLAEVAPDVNLKLPKFQALAAAVPEYGRPLDDGLYRAIDIYLKSHPWLPEADREQLCRLMDCQKLSLEACTHAAQNERLPLRIVVQVLFFEQLQLRTSIAGCFLASGNLDVSGEGGAGWASAVRENQVLKVGMDNMRMRVSELEKECSTMRHEIQKLGRNKAGTGAGPVVSYSSGAWWNVSRKLGLKAKSQMCSAQEGSVSSQTEKAKQRRPKQKKNLFPEG